MGVQTVACVLRTGGVYSAEWVRKLRAGVRANYLGPLRFVCLTDDPEVEDLEGVEVQALDTTWPGWWAKLELFAPGRFDDVEGAVLYLDLDTLVVASLYPLVSRYSTGDMALLSDLNRPSLAQSGVMLWRPGGLDAVAYERFAACPEDAMHEYKGDGQFLHATVGARADRVQDLVGPGAFVSLKRDARLGCPPAAMLVCAHGRPKFHEPAAGWAHAHWSAL